MQTLPLIMMLVTNTIVTFATIYFFLKVLKSPHKELIDEGDETSFPRGG
jgi:hypothetical protein